MSEANELLALSNDQLREKAAQLLADKISIDHESKSIIDQLREQLNHKTKELDEKVQFLEEDKQLADHKFERMQRECKQTIHAQYEHVIDRLQQQLSTVLCHAQSLANQRAALLTDNQSKSIEYEMASNSMKHQIHSLETLHESTNQAAKVQIETLTEKLKTCHCLETNLENQNLKEQATELRQELKSSKNNSELLIKELESKLSESEAKLAAESCKVLIHEQQIDRQQKLMRKLELELEEERSRLVDLKSALTNQELDQRREAQIFEERISISKIEFHEELTKMQIRLEEAVKKSAELDMQYTKHRQQELQIVQKQECKKCNSSEKRISKTSEAEMQQQNIHVHKMHLALELCQQELKEQKEVINGYKHQMNEQKQANAHLERLMRVTQRQCKHVKQQIHQTHQTDTKTELGQLDAYTNEIDQLEQRLQKMTVQHQKTLSAASNYS